MNVEIGYAPAASALVIEQRVSAGITPEAAAEMVADEGNTNSPLAFWASMIPFTSPIVMIARIPFGIPAWEIVTSLIVLYITFIFVTWLAARIFRIGIFMHGKRPSWHELWMWLKTK